ncbi:DUF6928 family protein [Gordonia soli]|uniref:Uncharacterized protein n=1 Tax=Gordonia soli NBRC 108243 TaxID=1223545 RepID=M0QIM4_9ACTN|nr:hypothetical protein [Gordonia soli]GAC68299.1 hypothetical protein GS4_14_01310 [Gordonia soli NBRC 108243]
MSARAVTLWLLDHPDPAGLVRAGLTGNLDAARDLAGRVYPDNVLVPVVDTNLAAAVAATDPHVYVGAFGPIAVITCGLFATTTPSDLTRTVAALHPTGSTVLLVTDPASTVGAFARWDEGELRRSFAATPVSITEDIGLPYVFEKTYWAGDHPLQYANGHDPEPFALPFHPQQLAEDANRDWVGFRFTHPLAPTDTDPARIPVTGFAIHPAGYVPPPVPNLDARTAGPTPAAPPSVPESAPHRGRIARYFGFGGR